MLLWARDEGRGRLFAKESVQTTLAVTLHLKRRTAGV
jgi:hypothetical protein